MQAGAVKQDLPLAFAWLVSGRLKRRARALAHFILCPDGSGLSGSLAHSLSRVMQQRSGSRIDAEGSCSSGIRKPCLMPSQGVPACTAPAPPCGPFPVYTSTGKGHDRETVGNAIMTKQQKEAGGFSMGIYHLPRSTTSQTKSALVTNKIRHGSSHQHAPFRPPPASAALQTHPSSWCPAAREAS